MKQLINFEIEWYANAMKDALMRYKLFVVFASLMIASSLDSLKSIFIFPTRHLFDEYTNTMSVLIPMVLFQGVGLIFFTIHYATGTKQPGKRFLLALPITAKQIVFKELVVLFVWNGLLWLSLAFAAWGAFFQADNVLGKFFLNMGLVLLLQLFLKTWGIGFFNVRRNHHRRIREKPSFKIAFRPFTGIQVINLWVCRSRLTLQTIVLIFSLIISCLLISYQTETLHLLLIVAIFSLINSIIVSHLFIHLRDERFVYFSYLTALPLSRWMVLADDLFIAVSTLIICNFPLFFTARYFLTSSSYVALSIIYFISLLFLVINYYPQTKFKKYGLFFVLSGLPIFAWLDYFMLTPFI